MINYTLIRGLETHAFTKMTQTFLKIILVKYDRLYFDSLIRDFEARLQK